MGKIVKRSRKKAQPTLGDILRLNWGGLRPALLLVGAIVAWAGGAIVLHDGSVADILAGLFVFFIGVAMLYRSVVELWEK